MAAANGNPCSFGGDAVSFLPETPHSRSGVSPRAGGGPGQIPLGNDLIHAPTGAVLLQLRWLCLEGRHDPVDELEQPVFAWK